MVGQTLLGAVLKITTTFELPTKSTTVKLLHLEWFSFKLTQLPSWLDETCPDSCPDPIATAS